MNNTPIKITPISPIIGRDLLSASGLEIAGWLSSGVWGVRVIVGEKVGVMFEVGMCGVGEVVGVGVGVGLTTKLKTSPSYPAFGL